MAIRILGSQNSDEPLTDRDVVTVTGWGFTKARNGNETELATDGTENAVSPALMQISQRRVDRACDNRAVFRNRLAGYTICATPMVSGQDSCNGDSGGPVTVVRGRDRFLVGLVSWGMGCALGNPALYTNASAYLSWIDDAKRALLRGSGNLTLPPPVAD
jgi:secreted trypsin-like serine protease